jgi:Flp pilus assembly protein TadD
LILDGRPDDAIPWLERALRLNPREPRRAVWQGFMARAHFTARRYDEAVDWARRAVRRQPAIPDLHLVLAASLGQIGDAAGAGEALGQCESARPGYTSTPELWYPYAASSDWEHFVDGLRKAGWKG